MTDFLRDDSARTTSGPARRSLASLWLPRRKVVAGRNDVTWVARGGAS